MVSSSKKKRGKQRKVAKTLAASSNRASTPNVTIADLQTPSRVIELVQRGVNSVTLALSTYDGWKSSTMDQQNTYTCTGAVLAVLGFLKRCEHETFVQVMRSVRGNLKTPSTWLDIIVKATSIEQSYNVQIIENIGPLVQCMCADTERMFFKSNKYWKEGIIRFVQLIHNMIVGQDAQNIDNLLSKYECLLGSIIQWGYWREERRPDITNELGFDTCAQISCLGIASMQVLMKDALQRKDIMGLLTDDSKRRLRSMNNKSIVSNTYEPNCKVSYVEGLIKELRRIEDGVKVECLDTLHTLITEIDCVDRGVITEMINFGFNCTAYQDVAEVVVKITGTMVLRKSISPQHVDTPSDTRAASAIRAGLIEMYLKFIDRFGGQESFARERTHGFSLFQIIEYDLLAIHTVSLHVKSWKAIRHEIQNIEEELIRVQQNTNIANNVHCNRLLVMIRSILDINGSYCCRCNKSLGRTDVKLCDGCGSMAYCSRSCQKEDWLNGHSVTCNNSFSVELAGQFQGRVMPSTEPDNERAVAKLKDLEVNMNMIQLKLFLDHSESILNQASSMNRSLLDCAVRFDLRDCPPKVRVVTYIEYFTEAGVSKNGLGHRSKHFITCYYISSVHLGNPGYNGQPGQLLCIQRQFPLEWLVPCEVNGKLQFLSGKSTLTPDDQKERKQSLALCMSLLVHTSTCELTKCVSASCVEMKRCLKHYAECEVKINGWCRVCQRIWALLHIHARRCQAESCPVPNCMSIRERHRPLLTQEATIVAKGKDTTSTELANESGGAEVRVEDIPRIVKDIMEEDVSCLSQLDSLMRRDDPPTQKVFESGVLPRLVEFLQRFDSHALQSKAVSILLNVASGEREHTEAIVELGVVPHLICLLHSVHSEIPYDAAWTLGNIAVTGPEYRDLVLQAGALQPLIMLLLEQTSDLKLVRINVWTLAKLCYSRDRTKSAFQLVSQSLHILKELIHHSDEEILLDACSALYHLSADSDSEQIQAIIDVLKDCGICRLLELCSHYNTGMQDMVLKVLGNIATGTDLQTQLLIDNNALPVLSDLLSGSSMKRACWAISNISGGTINQVQAVIDCGIIPKLITLLSNKASLIRRESVWALSNALNRGSVEQAKLLMKEGCIPPFVALLKDEVNDIVIRVLIGLESMLQLRKVEAFKVIIAAQGDRKIEDLQRHANNEIRERSTCIMSLMNTFAERRWVFYVSSS